MPRYTVTLAHASGEVTEKEYSVGWDLDKVDASLIYESCAVETTISSGRNSDGTYKQPCKGLSVTKLA